MNKNQNDAVLARLRKGPITQLDAYTEMGVTRLSARIFDLRAAGHEIKSTQVARENRFGEICKVSEYTLVNEVKLSEPRIA